MKRPENPYGNKSDLLYLDSDIGEVGKAAQIDAFEEGADAGMKALLEDIGKHLQRGYASLYIEEAYWQEIRKQVLGDEA